MTSDDQSPVPLPQQVERTGIALVHEGERIFPGERSAAALSPLTASVVNYHFPVEIEVVGGTEEFAERIFAELRMHIESLV
jgi:hypothetical protein